MGAAREKVQADFDLERFIDMFDEALTSKDERVVNALRSLMMMVVLTKPEVSNEGHDRNYGPLRQMFDDLHNINRRMHSLEDTVRQMEYYFRREREDPRTYNWPDQKTTLGYTLGKDYFNTSIGAVPPGINYPTKFTKL